MASVAPPEQGQIVEVRHRRFVVADVAESTLPQSLLTPSLFAVQHLVTLASVEDDALQAPFRSGIAIEDYQLDPVVRAIQMPRVNLLIADDVGLGKTIEAGLVIQELIIRHRARRILIVCPATLQIQWRDQMREKFGLEFRIVDAELMRELRRARGIHVNPWGHFPRLITSIDYLKRDQPMRLFRETLPAAGELAYPKAMLAEIEEGYATDHEQLEAEDDAVATTTALFHPPSPEEEALLARLIQRIPIKAALGSQGAQAVLGVRHPLGAARLGVAGKGEQHGALLLRWELLDQRDDLVVGQGDTRHPNLLVAPPAAQPQAGAMAQAIVSLRLQREQRRPPVESSEPRRLGIRDREGEALWH